MKFIFILIVLLFLLFLLINFSPLIGAKKISTELKEAEPIYLSGKTLFISDLHLKNLSQIDIQFDVDNLIIVGDFFHSPKYFSKFGKDKEEIFKRVLEKLISANSSTNVYYILCRDATHDPHLSEFDFKFDNVNFRCLGTKGHFVLEELHIFAIHGDQINRTGVMACAISYFSKLLGKPLILERFWKNLAKIDKDYWLITGHSHIPAIDYENKIANCGSWVGVPLINFLLRIPTKTGILFKEKEIKLIKY
ncbi:MAG: hypothetical protein QME61_04250 [Patescibacteria group bacterium]|nr:hypothetical protein [Patescibacteria group bacterium]